MFSLPRDTVDIPLPPGPLRNAYSRGVYPKKINALFTSVRNRPDLVPGNNRTRGYNGLKEVLGYVYGLDIKYFVEVNFDGFKQVVDALGGVTINVQIPVSDESYPSDTGRLARVYIPAGIQHMTGAEALVYARSRHGWTTSTGARQQRVLTSLQRAGGRRVTDPADPGAPRGLQGDRQDGHPAGPAGEAGRAREHGRHEEHPLVRVLVPALRVADPGADLQVPARRHEDPGGGRERLQGGSQARGHALRPRRRERLDLGPRRSGLRKANGIVGYPNTTV
jgi:LCP family protein required for cell wall assembly